MVPVQSLWGLQELHSLRVKRNVTYQLQTWQSIQSVKQYGNMMFWGHEILGQWSIMEVFMLVKIYLFEYTYILINFKVVMQVHHESSNIWLIWVKTIVVISNIDSDSYSHWSCIRRRDIFRPQVVDSPSSWSWNQVRLRVQEPHFFLTCVLSRAEMFFFSCRN